MRKIAYILKDRNYFIKIKEFCKIEDLGCVDVTDYSLIGENQFLVLITDDVSVLPKNVLKIVPVCTIDHEPKDNILFYILDKKFNIFQFRTLVDCICHGGATHNFLEGLMPVRLDNLFVICNDLSKIDKIIYNITKSLTYFFKFSEIQKLRIGLSEILTNAVEHGNLGITDTEKHISTMEGTFYELLDNRINREENKLKRIKFFYKISDNQLRVTIEDGGDGFDTSIIEKMHNDKNVYKLHGRGILIAKLYFDKVIYNEKGNKATLIKDII